MGTSFDRMVKEGLVEEVTSEDEEELTMQEQSSGNSPSGGLEAGTEVNLIELDPETDRVNLGLRRREEGEMN